MPQQNHPVTLRGPAQAQVCVTHKHASLTFTLECAGWLVRCRFTTEVVDGPAGRAGPPLVLLLDDVRWGRTSRPIPPGGSR